MILVMTIPEHGGAIFWNFSSLKRITDGQLFLFKSGKRDAWLSHLSPVGYSELSGLWNYVKDRVSVSSKKTYLALPGQESLQGKVVGRTFTPAEHPSLENGPDDTWEEKLPC